MTGPAQLNIPDAARKLLLQGAGIGGGVTVAYLLSDLVKAEPKLIVETLSKWGPYFIIAIAGMYLAFHVVEMFDNRLGQMVAISEKSNEAALKNAVAMQELADGVKMIATKDDQRTREQELLLDHLNGTNSKIFVALEGIQEEQKRIAVSAEATKSKGATA